MRYAVHYRKYRWFVYRVRVGAALDLRTPISGITSYGHDEVEALDIAFRRAYQRYPCRPHEMFCVVRCTDRASKHQAFLMEQAKKRDDAAFMELLGVE